jgi:hypothetical protein
MGPGGLHRETGITRKRGRDLLFPSPTSVCWLFGADPITCLVLM